MLESMSEKKALKYNSNWLFHFTSRYGVFLGNVTQQQNLNALHAGRSMAFRNRGNGGGGGGISTGRNVCPLRACGLSHRNQPFAPFLPIEAKEIGTVTKSDGLVAV